MIATTLIGRPVHDDGRQSLSAGNYGSQSASLPPETHCQAQVYRQGSDTGVGHVSVKNQVNAVTARGNEAFVCIRFNQG